MAEAIQEEEEEEFAQWMPECDDCDRPAEHICKTCGDKLCTGCKDNHLSRKKNRHHEVIPYSLGLKIRCKSTSTCQTHLGERYQMYCKPCQCPVCSLCITKSHADFNHAFISIADAFADAKAKATSKLERMTKKIRPALKTYSEQTKEVASNAQMNIDETETNMRRHAELLHSEVDAILENGLKQLQNIRERNVFPVLLEQEQNGRDLNARLESDITEYEEKLRSDDPIDLITFMKERVSEDPDTCFLIPAIIHTPLPTFYPGTIDRKSLQHEFGSIMYHGMDKSISDLTLETAKTTNEEIIHAGEKEDADNFGSLSRGKSEGKSRQQRMKDPQLQKDFSIATDYLGVLRLCRSDLMFVSGCGQRILLVDQEGHVIRYINIGCHSYNVTGMCVTNVGEVLFVDNDDRKVKKLHTDFRISTLCTTEDCQPFGICQPGNGEWLISFPDEKLLRVYTSNGSMKKDIKHKSLLKPKHVTVNKVNNDICVSDNDRQVIVFSSSGQKRFTYIEDSGSGFTPSDLCCDQLGNILITDCRIHRVHIIDRDGHFLQYLVSGRENISYPITIDIDNSGYAWIGEWKSTKVKCYKYLS